LGKVTGRFVDIHTHVVPSGDDGAQTLEDGIALCASAARHGTRVLFATPHVWPHKPLDAVREQEVRAAYSELARRADIDLRLGFELTPAPALLDEDPRRYRLGGTDAVLMEVPFSGPTDVLWALAEHVEAAGLRPVIAHPERTEAVRADPNEAERLARRGWLLQVNATSILGSHGEESEELAWRFVEAGLVSLIASDGHRTTRPPHLDEAYEAVRARLGAGVADSLFDGSALGLAAAARAA
jgi:protein-tyrosine phosphatase